MAVIEHYELPRVSTLRFGGLPDYTRRFVCVVDSPATTTNVQYLTAIGVNIQDAHPETSAVICREIAVNEGFEGNRYHTELVCTYEFVQSQQPQQEQPEDPNANIHPLSRPDRWKLETGSETVAALSYLDGNILRPLTNSAYDFFEGLTVQNGLTKMTVTANRPTFPSTLATQLTNCINSDGFLGAPPHHWKCAGIVGELFFENYTPTGQTLSENVRYWQIGITLELRQGGWNLQLPDVGFNYIGGGQKRRVMTFDFENAEWIPSPVPMGLDGFGAQTFGAPAILNRRIYREIPFNSFFPLIPP